LLDIQSINDKDGKDRRRCSANPNVIKRRFMFNKPGKNISAAGRDDAQSPFNQPEPLS
jgi:hypothetical protein